MPFSKGDKVQSRNDPGKTGMVEALGPLHAGIQYYQVFFGGAHGTRMVAELDLRPYDAVTKPSQHLIAGNLAGYQAPIMRLLKILRQYDRRRCCPTESSPEAPKLTKPFEPWARKVIRTSEAAGREFDRWFQASLHGLRMNSHCPGSHIGWQKGLRRQADRPSQAGKGFSTVQPCYL
jgi:hypothetical protein